MTKDLSKIFKNGENLKFKKTDYSSLKVKKEMEYIIKKQKAIIKSIEYTKSDLDKISYPPFRPYNH